MTIGIKAISYVVPGTPVGNSEIIATHGFDGSFIENKLGITHRHIAGPNEYVSDLATQAASKLLQGSGVSAEAVEILVVVTQTPDYCLPHVSALVHENIGLGNQVAAFDVSLGCSGYVYGLSIVQGMMESQGLDNGLLITADTYSKISDPSERSTAPLFGDAATATLLTRDPQYSLGRFDFGTDGSKHRQLIARGSGIRRDVAEPLFMDGRGIFNFAMSAVPKTVERCLERNDTGMETIDSWLFHQASRYMLESLAKRMKIPAEKLLIDMEDVGNTTSSTIPIVLARRILENGTGPNTILLCGFGVGLSWASTILTVQK